MTSLEEDSEPNSGILEPESSNASSISESLASMVFLISGCLVFSISSNAEKSLESSEIIFSEPSIEISSKLSTSTSGGSNASAFSKSDPLMAMVESFSSIGSGISIAPSSLGKKTSGSLSFFSFLSFFAMAWYSPKNFIQKHEKSTNSPCFVRVICLHKYCLRQKGLTQEVFHLSPISKAIGSLFSLESILKEA